MSKKKNRHAAPRSGKDNKNISKLQGSNETKKFNPLARNLLYADLVFLAVAQIMYNHEMIGEVVSNIVTIVGLVLVVIALVIQFGPKNEKPKPPRL